MLSILIFDVVLCSSSLSLYGIHNILGLKISIVVGIGTLMPSVVVTMGGRMGVTVDTVSTYLSVALSSLAEIDLSLHYS